MWVLCLLQNITKHHSQICETLDYIFKSLALALDFTILRYFKKQIKWHVTIPIAIGGVLGAAGGFFLTDIIGGNFTSKLFGGFLILLGLKEIFSKNKTKP